MEIVVRAAAKMEIVRAAAKVEIVRAAAKVEIVRMAAKVEMKAQDRGFLLMRIWISTQL